MSFFFDNSLAFLVGQHKISDNAFYTVNPSGSRTTATDKPDKRTSLYGSKIEECLKDLFKKAEIVDGEHCSAAIATLIEATHLDIQADPLLNR